MNLCAKKLFFFSKEKIHQDQENGEKNPQNGIQGGVISSQGIVSIQDRQDPNIEVLGSEILTLPSSTTAQNSKSN